jgi:hypothetical protein
MSEIIDISALNSRVKFDKTDVPFGEREILGDATETGLTRFAGRHIQTDYDSHLKKYRKAFEGKLTIPYFVSHVAYVSYLQSLSTLRINGLWL